MSKSRSFASLALGGAALLLAGGSANAVTFGDFPAIGQNTDGPALLITLGPGGAAVSENPGQHGAYEGSDDAYIGLWNNTNATVGFITLSGPNIFGFENDGIGLEPPAYCVGAGCGTSDSYGAPNPNDPSGYGGPLGFFDNIVGNTGNFNIFGGLAPGASTWFSLEQAPNLATLQVTANGTTPLPAALPMFAGGLGAVGGLLWRRKRKARAATA